MSSKNEDHAILECGFKTISGQIYKGDGISIQGKATQVDSVFIIVLDDNGTVHLDTININKDTNNFSKDNYQINNFYRSWTSSIYCFNCWNRWKNWGWNNQKRRIWS